jgi:hypothetical protein
MMEMIFKCFQPSFLSWPQKNMESGTALLPAINVGGDFAMRIQYFFDLHWFKAPCYSPKVHKKSSEVSLPHPRAPSRLTMAKASLVPV